MANTIVQNWRFQNLSGQTCGRWTVIKFAGVKNRQTFWRCRCQCGVTKDIWAGNLKSGKTKSCGCLHRETLSKRNRTHGLSETSEYEIWCGIKKRCLDPKHKAFHRYGGRGISICQRWLAFENFLADMGCRPSLFHSVDRIDNDGNYEPGNCRWATPKEQANNSRRLHLIAFQGKVLPIGQWALVTGINHTTIRTRLRDLGWSIEKALSRSPTRNPNVRTKAKAP